MEEEADAAAPTSWVVKAGATLLTVNSGIAIYRSGARGDAGAVAFVVASYAALLLLFACLRAYERAAPGAPARAPLKRAVWAATALLTTMFAWKVAALMPWPVAAVVWGLAAATVVGGFVALFVRA